MGWIHSALAVAVSLVAIFVEPVHLHQSSAYIGGHNGFFSSFGKSHHFPHIVPVRKTISIPKHVPVIKHVSLPLPYPVFRPEQVPMYKAVPVKMDKIVRVPVKVPKYYSVPVHKVIAVPRYVEVPVEVPIYQEVFVKRVVEVPVPVYIKRPAKHSEASHSSGGGYHQPILKDHSDGASHGSSDQAVVHVQGGHDASVHAASNDQHGQVHTQVVQHGQGGQGVQEHGQIQQEEVQHAQVVEEAHHENVGQEAKHSQEVHAAQSAHGHPALAVGLGGYTRPASNGHQQNTAENKGHHVQQAQEVLQAQAAQLVYNHARGPYHAQNAHALPQSAPVHRALHAQQVQGLQQMHPLHFVHFAQPIQSWTQSVQQ